MTEQPQKPHLMFRFRRLFSYVLRQKGYYWHYKHFIEQKDLGVLSIYRALKERLAFAGKDILDFGCGVGYITHFMGAKGVDIDQGAVATAKKLYPKDRFLRLNKVEDLLKLGKFKAVTLINVAEHLYDQDRERLFSMVPRLLKKDGKVIFVYDDMFHPLQIVAALKKPGTLLLDPTHVYCWTQSRFRRLLEERFTIEHEEGGNIQLATLPWGNRFATARLYVCRPKA
jgi:2-polyprenyl-3-methyl-5-hydroxy-6-metoxy-1,4-benzoquinol methylase